MRKHFEENLGLLAVPTFPWPPSFQLLWKSRYAGCEQYSKNGIKLSSDKKTEKTSVTLKGPFRFQFTADGRDWSSKKKVMNSKIKSPPDLVQC